MKKIYLGYETTYDGPSVEKAIVKRRSERDFSGKTMSLAELSHILRFADGITEESTGLRAAPSAGATYPIEVYPAVNNVEGLARGIYRYLVSSHELELVREYDFSHEMSRAALGEQMIIRANVVLVLSAVFERTQRRYGDRAQRYIFFEAGHIAQNICLLAASMGLGSCAVGAFYDEALNRVVGVDGKVESVIYLLAIGTL